MPKLSINKGGTWNTARKFSVNLAGTWTTARNMWIYTSGAWQAITFLAPTSANFTFFPAGPGASMAFLNTGDVLFNGTSQTPAWLNDVATGNGTGFWMYFTRSAGAAAGVTFGSWLQMSSTRSIILTTTPGTFITSNGTYQVATDSLGANVVGSGTWQLSVT